MVTLKLSILDRLQMFSVLPKQGKTMEMEMTKNIEIKVKPTPKEITDWNITDRPDGTVTWNSLKAKEVAIEFEEGEFMIMQKGAELLESGGQVTRDNLELIKKIQAIKPKEEVPVKTLKRK